MLHGPIAGRPSLLRSMFSNVFGEYKLTPTTRLKKSILKQLSKTQLPNGKLSMLVDPGSVINVIGENTARRFAAKATEHNQHPEYAARRTALHVNGVGSDSAVCVEEALLPIAVKFQERPVSHEVYRANVAKGCGSDLPAIHGQKSMAEKNAVLFMKQGQQMMAFPGPGGYKVEWSPGTKLLPLVQAPSGHLVVPCDSFDDLQSSQSSDSATAFCTDHSCPL